MEKPRPSTNDIGAVIAAMEAQKRAIQMIFQTKDFAAMPAAQQRLAQLREELRILRLQIGSG